jgi:glycosyltransferase involved in cell wall biosynthesis
MAKFSFIITARNEAPEVVQRTIDGLMQTARAVDFEIVLIDDGSTLPIAPRDGVRLVRNPEPLGVSRARRQGAELAAGDALCWMDAHMTFDPHWLEHMGEHLAPGVYLCSAFWSYDRTQCHGFGADFEWSGTRDYAAGRNPGLGLRHRTAHPGDGAVEVPMVIGACYLIHRDTYAQLGGLSPLFRVWGSDEQDFSARAWLAGVPVKCVTGARVGHMWRPQFPYPVAYDHLEFNQLALLRTVFEEATIATLEPWFEPLPPAARAWLDEADVAGWRAVVQAARKIGDREFLARFLPRAPRPK